jgi:hypothetical protein
MGRLYKIAFIYTSTQITGTPVGKRPVSLAVVVDKG